MKRRGQRSMKSKKSAYKKRYKGRKKGKKADKHAVIKYRKDGVFEVTGEWPY